MGLSTAKSHRSISGETLTMSQSVSAWHRQIPLCEGQHLHQHRVLVPIEPSSVLLLSALGHRVFTTQGTVRCTAQLVALVDFSLSLESAENVVERCYLPSPALRPRNPTATGVLSVFSLTRLSIFMSAVISTHVTPGTQYRTF